MLLSGGNAFDAAVAAGFAAAVVEPTASYTLCGECVALVHDARRRETLAAQRPGAPRRRSRRIDFFRGRGLDRIPTGPGADAHLSFTVPGAVDAYLTLLETHGTQDAQRGAGAGRALRRARLPDVRVHAPPARPSRRRAASSTSIRPAAPPCSTRAAACPEVGELFVQPALAGTLRQLVEADAQGARTIARRASPPRGQRFYRGDIAATIGAFSERLGRLLRAGDLAGYRAPARGADCG